MKKQFSIVLLVLTLASCITQKGSAQNIKLAVHPYSTIHSARFGDTILFPYRIVNKDTNGFTASIQIRAHLIDSNGISRPLTHVLHDTVSFNSHGNDSVVGYLKIIVTRPYFFIGPDVVVIWPNIQTGGTLVNFTDSLMATVNIVTTGIEELEVPKIRFGFTENKLLFSLLDPENKITQVIIMNTYGQVVNYDDNFQGNELPLGTLPTGVYICEVVLRNNYRKGFQFLH